MLWVKDPLEEGDLSDTDRDGLQVAMARWHAATLLAPLGLAEIAKPLLELVRTPFRNRADTYRRRALEALTAYSPMLIESDSINADDLLIGGFVTPAGPLGPAALASDDRAMLRRLGIRSAFVGIELGALKRAIEGIPEESATATYVETRAAKPETGVATFDRRSGEDGAGSWVVRLDDERTTVTPLNRAT